MTFAIDTGNTTQAPFAQSSAVDPSQSVDLANIERAERIARKITEAIQSCETVQDLQTYWDAESLMLDAFYMTQHVLHQRIQDVYEEHRAIISCDRAPKLATADPNPAEPGNSLGIKF